MAGKRTRWMGLRLWCCVVVAWGVLVACLPQAALAKSYQVDGVEVDATVAPDGSLSVVERRTYVFSGSYNGIYWDVPCGSFAGREIAATVDEVAVQQDSATYAFDVAQTVDVGAAGTFELSKEADCLRLKLYWPADDERVTFEVRYRLTNLVTRWSDTAELYWQYVPSDEESDSEWLNVVASVHLPVPPGEKVVPGENVHAWGHGPIDGEVGFVGDAAVFTSPGVGSAEFLEARVAFPAKWLTEVQGRDEARFETILAEEEQWVADANAQRRRARRITYGIPGFLGFAGIATFLAALIHKKGLFKKKRNDGTFQGTYFRDVPTNDHPAVLGMLYRHGNSWRDDLAASIMRLSDIGGVKVDAVEVDSAQKHGKLARKKQVCRLSYLPGGKDRSGNMRAGTKQIDDATSRFLFDTVAGHMKLDDALRGSEGEPYVLTSFFEELADEKPTVFEHGYFKWELAVKEAYNKRKFEVSSHMEGGIYPGILGLADFALFAIVGLIGALFEVPNIYLLPAMGMCFAAGLYCVWNSDEERVVEYSDEAKDIQAKLEALKRWLTDFTRLEEAVPTDVVLWNRLLVMATVLGVADKVIDQLKVVQPLLLEDEDFLGSTWYSRDLEKVLQPATAIEQGLRAAGSSVSSQLHSVSTSSTASSRDSSSRGSGGGFSGGGGGGFSGGGRGGAF